MITANYDFVYAERDRIVTESNARINKLEREVTRLRTALERIDASECLGNCHDGWYGECRCAQVIASDALARIPDR